MGIHPKVINFNSADQLICATKILMLGEEGLRDRCPLQSAAYIRYNLEVLVICSPARGLNPSYPYDMYFVHVNWQWRYDGDVNLEV